MDKQVLIELEPELAEDLARKLRDNNIDVEGPDDVDSLDGVAIAALIVTVTPHLKDLIVSIIKAIKGSSGTIQTADSTVSLQNATEAEIRAILASSEVLKKGSKDAGK